MERLSLHFTEWLIPGLHRIHNCLRQWVNKWKQVKVFVAQLCPTFWDPMGCSLPDSSVHRTLQVSIQDWRAIPFSRGSSWPRNQTRISCIAGRFFTIWARVNKRRASLVALSVKNLPAMWETQVWFLGWEDPLEEGMANHSSILVWRIPVDQRSLAGCSPWYRKEPGTTERLSTHNTRGRAKAGEISGN